MLVWCSRMKLVSEGSTSPNTVGVKKEPVPACLATIYGSTDTPMGQWSLWRVTLASMPYCNTVCMNLFLRELSNQFPDDIVLLCCDGAAWHKSKMLDIPENIVFFTFPPIHRKWIPSNKFGKKSENWALKIMFLLVISIRECGSDGAVYS